MEGVDLCICLRVVGGCLCFVGELGPLLDQVVEIGVDVLLELSN